MPTNGPILLVEDDKDDREILAEAFESLGIKNELKFFDEGQAIIDYLMVTTDKPFLIITDVNLPGVSGDELAQRIYETPYLRKKSIPFIFLTTAADPRSVNKAYEMMVQGYFQKEDNFQQVKKCCK